MDPKNLQDALNIYDQWRELDALQVQLSSAAIVNREATVAVSMSGPMLDGQEIVAVNCEPMANALRSVMADLRSRLIRLGVTSYLMSPAAPEPEAPAPRYGGHDEAEAQR